MVFFPPIPQIGVRIEKKMKSPPIWSSSTGWWFFPTRLKNMLVKLDHFLQGSGWKKIYVKPPRVELDPHQSLLPQSSNSKSPKKMAQLEDDPFPLGM